MGAAEEQLKELGEKLEAAPPDPADDLAKLLEVRTCYCSLGGSVLGLGWLVAFALALWRRGGGCEVAGFGWICGRIRQV